MCAYLPLIPKIIRLYCASRSHFPSLFLLFVYFSVDFSVCLELCSSGASTFSLLVLLLLGWLDGWLLAAVVCQSIWVFLREFVWMPYLCLFGFFVFSFCAQRHVYKPKHSNIVQFRWKLRLPTITFFLLSLGVAHCIHCFCSCTN